MGFDLSNIDETQRKSKLFDLDGLLNKEIQFFSKSFSNKDKEAFYTELGVLLKAGVTLKESLDLIGESIKKKQKQELIEDLKEGLLRGENLAQTMSHHSVFSQYERFSIKLGEETGNLIKVTEELGRFYMNKNAQRRQVVNALTYPCIICITALLVLLFMLNYVVPMFQDIFSQQGVELPGITKFIIRCSEFMQSYGLVFILGILILLVSGSYFNKIETLKRFKDGMILRIPVIGEYIKTAYFAQFSGALALLTSSKVPLVYSIQMVSKMIPFYPLKVALCDIEKRLISGVPLSESLKAHSIFSPKIVALIRVAEQTNRTSYVFNKLNAQFNADLQQRSKMLSTVLEPLIIIVIGGVVGIILVAMYLPMFRLSNILS